MSDAAWKEINFANLPFLEELDQQYQQAPETLPISWQEAFAHLPTTREKGAPTKGEPLADELRVMRLIDAYRSYGHLMADFDPIRVIPIEEPHELSLKTLGFTEAELRNSFPTCGIMASTAKATLEEIIQTLKSIYCNKIGFEYMGLQQHGLEKWLQKRIEHAHFKIDLPTEQKKMVLQQLNRSELFELFLHTKYTGQKRFSLEGAETLIPMLEAVIETGTKLELEQVVIGMAHRGRLNVLSNILNKSYAEIFAEFEDNYIPNSFEGSGDVKYHKGFSSEVTAPNGHKVQILLSPNPSHLESVDAVVEGQCLARQIKLKKEDAVKRVLPVIIHGDAAIAGQGIVYEVMQFCRLPGYATGGTLHFVINNQIGFTATADQGRSTRYCTDIARSFGAPVFHVNAEDPEGCVFVSNLAVEIRDLFHCDVFIDLNGYRKFGHNEGDEPAYTQPLEYKLIRQKRPIREIYRDQLIHKDIVEKHIAEALEADFNRDLQAALQATKQTVQQPSTEKKAKKSSPSQPINTSVTKETLLQIAEKISSIPEDFHIHPKLKTLVAERFSMIKEESRPIDWGMAELLAYGSLLWDGVDVRLSGQDCKRGTFSHRHAIWMDQEAERSYVPLNHLKENQGRFDVYNSSLSEYAVLGFEYGYSVSNPEALVIWEAQFGDFANGAQVVIDQYIATAEQKWDQKVPLTLFLPHGYEGQGPEHSSGRMERFLTLCGEENMRIVNPTTPAQLFHLLRNQVANPARKPLIVFTPKGLLRHPQCISTVNDLTQGRFEAIINDPKPNTEATLLAFCSGRIYYDLAAERAKRNDETLALIRIEQLYPLDLKQLQSLIETYPHAKQYAWVQEEPHNMGAWEFVSPLLKSILPENSQLEYIGRPRSASPATGSYVIHKKQYAEIINKLFKGDYES